MKVQLIDCGRRLIFMFGAYHCHYCGTAFYIEDREVLKVSFNSCIILDTAFSRKIDFSRKRPRVDELARRIQMNKIKENGTASSRLGDDPTYLLFNRARGFPRRYIVAYDHVLCLTHGVSWSMRLNRIFDRRCHQHRVIFGAL